MRENISPGRKQRKSPVWEFSLPPSREDWSPVRVATKTRKKRQGESIDQEKRKKIRPSEEVLNQYVPQTDGYHSEFDRVPQSVQSLDLVRLKKLTISVKCPLLLHERMTDIICSYFATQISQITSKETEKNILLPSICPLSIPLVNSEL